MAHIYLRLESSDDHPMSFHDYEELLQNDDEESVKIELNFTDFMILKSRSQNENI